MPNDEFELLLERCRERLSEISLAVPPLEGAAPPPAVYSLTPPAPPPKPAVQPKRAAPPAAPPQLVSPAGIVVPPLEPEAPPAPVRRPEAPPAPAAAAPAPPAAEPKTKAPAAEEREKDVFPPLRERPKTPPPSVPLWRAPDPPAAPAAETAAGNWRRPAAAAAAAAAAAVVAAGAFGVWLGRRPSSDISITAAGADAMAIRPEKGDMLVAEGKVLVDLSRDGRTLGRQPLDAPVDSLAWNQGSLWSVDGRTASVVEHAENGRATVFALNHVPGALYVKDKYLWTAEKGGHMLHEFLISRSILGALLQPLDSFELTGLSPEGFTIDDAGTLWLADGATRRLFRLRLENGSYKRISSAPLSPFVGPEGKLQDLTVEEDGIWLLAQSTKGGSASLRRIAINRLDWTPE